MSSTDPVAAPVLEKLQTGRLTTLRLNRPLHFNALSDEMLAALQTELDTLAGDETVGCVVIAGAGKAFCAGHDLREMRARPEASYLQDLFARCSRVMMSIASLPVPVIARVHGVATAAGCQLVATCDLAIAAETARFAVSGVNLGLFCSTPAVALSRNVTAKQAFDMLVTGRFIDALTAVGYGLVNEAVPEDDLDAAVARKVEMILAKSPAAIRYGKAMFSRQRQMPLADAYAYASDVMVRNMMQTETGEAVDAFLHKRPPNAR